MIFYSVQLPFFFENFRKRTFPVNRKFLKIIQCVDLNFELQKLMEGV